MTVLAIPAGCGIAAHADEWVHCVECGRLACPECDEDIDACEADSWRYFHRDDCADLHYGECWDCRHAYTADDADDDWEEW